MTPEAIDRAVALYADGRGRRRRIDGPAGRRAGRPTLEDAYAVQAALNARLAATHGAVCGRKIGCTTPVMQRYLEIAHPCAGALYENRTHAAPATVAYADHWRPGVECEIAVRLGRPLPGRRRALRPRPWPLPSRPAWRPSRSWTTATRIFAPSIRRR